MKRATIGDVAARAGVSTATVSRVLDGGVVADATATRVWEAVARLEYTPNARTTSIFAGRSRTIGVVIRDLTSPFYLDLIRGIDQVAAASDSLAMFANTFREIDREVAHIQTMDEQRVRGLIVTTGETTDSRTRRGLSELGLPVPEDAVAVAETEEKAGDAVGSLLARAQDRHEPLDAIVCTTGRLTVAVHSALTARGMASTSSSRPWSPADRAARSTGNDSSQDGGLMVNHPG